MASHQGKGFVVAEDECLANTRKGKQVLNVKMPDEARAIALVEGELVAAIGENRKMLIFPLEQVPEMARGRGVRLQRYKDGGLSDVKTFKAEDGLTWTDGAGRAFSLTLKELADWRGNRADAGRLAPKGFPRSNKFGGGGMRQDARSGGLPSDSEIRRRVASGRLRRAGYAATRLTHASANSSPPRLHEPRERLEGRLRHVVLDAFGIGLGGLGRHAERDQHLDHEAVAGAHAGGERLAAAR